MNIPTEEELRALFDKGGFDAIAEHATATAHKDCQQILEECIENQRCPFSATDGGDGKHSWKESSRHPGDFHCRYCGNYKSGRLPI